VVSIAWGSVKNLDSNANIATTLTDRCNNSVGKVISVNRTTLLGGTYFLYPNPAASFITFDLSSGSGNYYIKIYDGSGRIVIKKQVSTKKFTWNLRNNRGKLVSNGSYFADIEDRKSGKKDKLKFSVLR